MKKTYFWKAMEEDLKFNYKGAIDFYTKSIENEELNLESYLNLIGILVEVSLDFGMSSHLVKTATFTQEQLDDLYRYLETLLKKAEVQFGSNEITFWRYYKENFFRGFKRERIKQIAEMDDSSLVPYFQLYIYDLASDTETHSYFHKVQDLKVLLRAKGTIKNRYILSLIDSAENQKNLS